MPQHIPAPALIPVPGGKRIAEFAGMASTGDARLSIAHMTAPAGWDEPAQQPEFDEFTLVLDGAVDVHHDGGLTTVRAGEAIWVRGGERIRYACPEGATYVAVCLPAFSPATVHRDDDAPVA